MIKNATYKDKFHLLNPWFVTIVETVKKDLRKEHLRSDPRFCKQYFSGKNTQKATSQELADAYANALKTEENGEALGEFISNRWLLKNTELYDFFERELTKISPNFTELEEIPLPQSEALAQAAVEQFGATSTYLFSILNSVVFPQEVFTRLEQQSRDEEASAKRIEKQEAEEKKERDLKTHYEQQIARLTDKYEKKLQGLQKKYTIDTEQLKKQISQLHKKMGKG